MVSVVKLTFCLAILEKTAGFLVFKTTKIDDARLYSNSRGNYQEAFIRAQESRESSETLQNDIADAERKPWTAPEPTKPLTPIEMTQFKNKVPFDEDIYSCIKRVVEVLNSRMTSKAPLSLEEVENLRDDVEAIIRDSDLYLPPPKPPRRLAPPPIEDVQE